MSVSKIKATVFSQEQLASDVFSMWLEVGSIASEAKPGQFISVYSNDDSKLLPRPISICEIDREKRQTENCVPCCWLWYKKNSQDAKQETHWRLWGPLAMVIH